MQTQRKNWQSLAIYDPRDLVTLCGVLGCDLVLLTDYTAGDSYWWPASGASLLVDLHGDPTPAAMFEVILNKYTNRPAVVVSVCSELLEGVVLDGMQKQTVAQFTDNYWGIMMQPPTDHKEKRATIRGN